MATDWSQFTPVDDEPPRSGGVDWSQFEPIEAAQPQRSAFGRVIDGLRTANKYANPLAMAVESTELGRDIGSLGGGGFVAGTGRAVEGVERLGNDAISSIGEAASHAQRMSTPFGAWAAAGDPSRSLDQDRAVYEPSEFSRTMMAEGARVQGDVSPTTANAMADSELEGDIFAPSTWSLGKNPSLRGLSAQVVKVGGEMAPIVAAGAVPGVGPGLAMTAAAGQSASGAYEENAQFVRDLPEPELQRVPEYLELLDRGASPLEAREHLADQAGRGAMVPAALVGAGSGAILSGAATKPLSRAVTNRFGDTFRARMLGNAAEIPLEGAQEVGEAAAGRAGANAAAGTDRDLTAGSFGDFVLGAAAAGPAAAISSIRPLEEGDDMLGTGNVRSDLADALRRQREVQPQNGGQATQAQAQQGPGLDQVDDLLARNVPAAEAPLNPLLDADTIRARAASPEATDADRAAAEALDAGAEAEPAPSASTGAPELLEDPSAVATPGMDDSAPPEGVEPIESLVDIAASEAATSPDNELAEPTDAQKEAGNYRKGKVRVNGLDISIENPAGSQRRPEWAPLQDHYGYVKGTTGKDGDQIDVFLAPRAEDESLPVFVVDQVNEDGAFDEHKVVLGAADSAEAEAIYRRNYAPDWQGLGGITEMSLDEFKSWSKRPRLSKQALSDAVKSGQPAATVAARKSFEAALAPSGNEVTDRLSERLADFEGAVDEYAALPDSNGGVVLNTDVARELSPDYRADRTKSADVHEPASAFIKQLYAKKLAQPTPADKDRVVLFTAGGTGAGKTTGQAAVGDALGRPEIIYDTNMNGLDSSVRKIEQALDAGREVSIIYTYRDPIEALTNGALKRAMRMAEREGSGRTVPLLEHVKTHVGAYQTVKALLEKYADDPRVDVRVIDNSRGKGGATEVDFDEIPALEDNRARENEERTTERAAGQRPAARAYVPADLSSAVEQDRYERVRQPGERGSVGGAREGSGDATPRGSRSADRGGVVEGSSSRNSAVGQDATRELLDRLRSALDAEFEAGRISESIYRGFLAGSTRDTPSTSLDTALADESDVSAPPAPGTRFVVFRLGTPEEPLANRNAGNANSVARYIASTQDQFSPSASRATTVTAFEVTAGDAFGKYQGLVREKKADGHEVGRVTRGKEVAYSFPEGTEARALGSVSLDELHERLSRRGFKDFDDAGSRVGAEAIREWFGEATGPARPDDQPMFSLPPGPSRGLPVEDLRARINAIVTEWRGDAPEVLVHATAEGFPDWVKADPRYREAEGFYDPRTGIVHLVAGNLDSFWRARKVLTHEATGHFAFEQMAGPETWAWVQAQVERMRADGRLKALFEDVDGRYPAPGADANVTADQRAAIERARLKETVAIMAERGIGTSIIDRLVAAFRRFLASMNMWTPASEDGIRQLIIQAARRLERPAPVGVTAGELEAEPAFSQPPQGKRQHTKAQLGFLSKAGLSPDTRTWLKRLQDRVREDVIALVNGLRDRDSLKQSIFDRFHGIRAAYEATGVSDMLAMEGYLSARLSTGLASVMESTMMHGAPEWRDGILSIKPGTKGLLEALMPVRENLDDWLGWMVARRAKVLKGQGRENLMSDVDIAAGLALADGREAAFAQAALDYLTLKNAILDVAEQAGLIDAQKRATWDHAEYIPFYRDKGDSVGPGTRKGLAGQSSGIQTLRGGESGLTDPLGNIVRNFTLLVDASLKNNAMNEIRADLGDAFFERVPSITFKPAQVPLSQVRKHLIEAGMSEDAVNAMPQGALEGIAKFWAVEPPMADDIVRIMVKGSAEYFKVEDPLLMRALTAFAPRMPGWFMKPMIWAKRVLTAGATATAEFLAANTIRDSLEGWMVADDNFRPMVDTMRGALGALQTDERTQDLMMSGSYFAHGHIYAGDLDATAAALRRSLRAQGVKNKDIESFVGSFARGPAWLWDRWTHIQSALEHGTRRAMQDAALEAGKSRKQAVFSAKDLLDFSMRGDSEFVAFFTDVVPFLNARLQGLYKLGRSYHRNRRQMAARGGTLVIASIALLAWNLIAHGDEYDKLEEWDRDMYWHIGPGTPYHVRIPKPFELGLIFGTVPERGIRALLNAGGVKGGESFEKTWRSLLHALTETLAFNPVPQAFAPIDEQRQNRVRFTGRPIENLGDERLLPEARVEWYTSATMQLAPDWFTNSTGMSPKRLEHLWRGYTAGLGQYALTMSDMLVRRAQDDPWRPAMHLRDYPLVGRFARGDAPSRSTSHQTEFYELKERAETIEGTIKEYLVRAVKEGRTDLRERALELHRENINLLGPSEYRKGAKANVSFAVPKQMRRVQEQLGRLRAEEQRIALDREIPATEKRDRIDKIVEQRNELLRNTVLMLRAAEQE